jgi:adenylate cyclase
MEHPYLKRQLKAILLADVVGYSRLMSIDEERTHVKIANYAKDLIEPKIAEHRGRLIRTMGDGFLVEFDSAADAVSCGLDIQGQLETHEAAADKDRRIRLRIGINTGDVISDDRDIYGNSVNIAARLEGLAEPGEIYVTRGVRDHLEGHPGLAFEDRGERRVKNIKNPIRVYRVKHVQGQAGRSSRYLIALGRRFSPARFRFETRATVLSTVILATVVTVGAAGLPAWRDQSRAVPRASIVVMPFNNLSNDPGQDYFADAITDDLTTDLSRLPGTFVIARATAFAYKNRAVDARQVGRECGVRYLLEGSIQRFGPKVQINAQLVDSESGAAIWGDRFDKEITDLFELQEAVTGRIAASMNIQLARAESRRSNEVRASDPDAIDLQYRAMGLYISGITAEHTLAARQLLEQSVKLDPKSAEAWAWLADLLMSDYLNRWNDAGTEQLQQAEAAVRQALAIDPSLALVHFANGFVHRAKGETAAALESFSEALKLNPNFARAYAQKANEVINAGKPEDAPPLVEKAIALSPRDPSLGVFYWNLGRAQFFSGQYRGAIPWLRKAVEERPGLWHNWLYLASAYALTGDNKEAAKVLADFKSHPSFRNTRVTLTVVQSYEQANPSSNLVVVEARRQFHDGLLKAGMEMN